MSHDITAADIGRPVKAVSTHEDGTVDTIEGVVRSVEPNGPLFVGVHCAYVMGSGDSVGWTVTVERIRPAVPTGLGAVVRLDGDDGPLAVLGDLEEHSDMRWALDGLWVENDDVAARIAKVESEGWTP